MIIQMCDGKEACFSKNRKHTQKYNVKGADLVLF